ncbi:MAG TPA: hypothetical protein VNT81_11750 [Vicinamibacterales bacterium]|nr:hypothetical protein [Vicinamibacterales bacterium]
MAAARAMGTLLAMLMLAQAALGLVQPDQYRDVEWIRATWYGNDWITLVAAVPLLWVGTQRAAFGSVRGLLLVLGIAGYATYNYAFYLLGAALNSFFPLYVVNLLCGVATLGVLLSHLDVNAVAASFRHDTPVRVVGGYLIFVALGLAVVWLGVWGAYAFAGRPTPVEPEAFKVVAALDLSMMVPALAAGGVLLWRRRAWGYLIASTAAIQATLYLLVLSVNSAIAISRGLAAAPGELPVWGPLAVFTALAAMLLLRSGSGVFRFTPSAP